MSAFNGIPTHGREKKGHRTMSALSNSQCVLTLGIVTDVSAQTGTQPSPSLT